MLKEITYSFAFLKLNAMNEDSENDVKKDYLLKS